MLFRSGLLEAKLREEATELATARERKEVIWEAADLMYFTLVALTRAGVSISEVEEELDRRALRLATHMTRGIGRAVCLSKGVTTGDEGDGLFVVGNQEPYMIDYRTIRAAGRLSFGQEDKYSGKLHDPCLVNRQRLAAERRPELLAGVHVANDCVKVAERHAGLVGRQQLRRVRPGRRIGHGGRVGHVN